MVGVRISPEEKEQFEAVANSIGVTPSVAINIFVTKFTRYGGFPFDVVNPEAAELLDDIAAYHKAKAEDDGNHLSLAEMRKELGI